MEVRMNAEMYAEEIRKLRYQGQLQLAIRMCEKAIGQYPYNNFFYKLLGDMYAQTGDYKTASRYYLEQLKRLQGRPEQFKSFARFYKTYSEHMNDAERHRYRMELLQAVEKQKIVPEIAERLGSLIGEEFLQDPKWRRLIDLVDEGNQVSSVREQVDQLLEEGKRDQFLNIMQHCLDSDLHNGKKPVDGVLIAAAERAGLYKEAIRLMQKDSRWKSNGPKVRTLLRICRKQQDYSMAEELLNLDKKIILKSDFNILYELVYYYEYRRDEESIKLTLDKIQKYAESSLPIARTLYNFYLQFNLFSEAKQILEQIREVEETKRHGISRKGSVEEQFESEQGVWNKLQELVSEQEHNRQMIAMRDLIKGFSHELGQPITDIRYSIQLYQMRAKMAQTDEKDIDALLHLILHQTERIGDMLDRFRPIVSGRSKEETFGVLERIEKVFQDLNGRLHVQGIAYALNGDRMLTLWGEPIQFDQIFYNLVLNSMQALAETGKRGYIEINVRKKGNDKIQIIFSDNGPGIEQKNTKKIFEPFFTTKAPSSGNGGEGLGLFIVWNILKMYNGKIRLDTEYKTGAKFIMTIEKAKEM